MDSRFLVGWFVPKNFIQHILVKNFIVIILLSLKVIPTYYGDILQVILYKWLLLYFIFKITWIFNGEKYGNYLLNLLMTQFMWIKKKYLCEVLELFGLC